jgi:hypothetical protein
MNYRFFYRPCKGFSTKISRRAAEFFPPLILRFDDWPFPCYNT